MYTYTYWFKIVVWPSVADVFFTTSSHASLGVKLLTVIN